MKRCTPALLSLTLCLAASLCAQDYEIKFERPLKAGQKSSLTAHGTLKQSQIVKVDGQVAQQNAVEFNVDLDADAVIVKVSEQGKPSCTEYTIKKLTRTDGEKVSELLPAGKVVVVEPKEDAPPFSLKDGGELQPATMEALDLVITDSKKKQNRDDDQLYGTKERQAVGAEWPIDAEQSAASLSDKALKLTKENMSGSVRVASAEKCNELDCLRLELNIVAKDFQMPLPPGMKLEGALITVSAVGLFPVDTAAPRQNEQLEMQMSALAKGQQDGKSVEVEIMLKRTDTVKRKFVD